LEQLVLPADALQVDAGKLDFELILHTVVRKHSEAILTTFWTQLQHSKVFSPPGVVSLILDGMILSMDAK
jgi:mediator of RNA polymerase II transcription subunit 14